MKLLDTNGVTLICEQNLSLSEQYLLAPEIIEETEMTQLKLGKSIPSNILSVATSEHFSEARYLAHYKYALNKFGGRSFFNMTGFGDISILATVLTILESFAYQKSTQLFDPTEPIVVFTDDTGLIKRIGKEFSGHDVSVRGTSQIT